MTDLTAALKAYALALGFSKVGIASANVTEDYLSAWLVAGYHGTMAWMEDPRRRDIQQVLAGVQSVLVVALNYKLPPDPKLEAGLARISCYTRGRDYHKVLGNKLKHLTRWLREKAPDHQHRWYVDTGPINEKVWAQRAGLGWIGKNSLLLTREYGSWVFLGVVVTTLDLAPDAPTSAHCGTCQRCVLACPTTAILPGGVVDSTRCIAYHTLENPAPELPELLDLQGWVVGCDLCQTCCPFNTKTPNTTEQDFWPRPGTQGVPLQDFVQYTDAQFDQWSQGMALRRVRAMRLRRNARHAAMQGVQTR